MRPRAHIRAHIHMFCRDFLGFTGVADILGVLALIAFFASLVQHHDHPNWLWLSIFLAIAFVVEIKITNKLLRDREDEGGGDEPKISAKAHAHAMAEVMKHLGDEKGAKG